MARRVFVGDKIRVRHGTKHVHVYVRRVETWRQLVREMFEAEAREFTERCIGIVGDDYRDSWVRVFVLLDGKTVIFEPPHFTVVEGRLEKRSDGWWEKKAVKAEAENARSAKPDEEDKAAEEGESREASHQEESGEPGKRP